MKVTLTGLLIFVALVAAVITGLMKWLYRGKPNWLMSYLQNFSGVFFIVSGAVKAVDPLGMAYKMEQYFAEFESVFSETWMSFIVPMFTWMSSISSTVALAIIVLEIVLGIMLIIGYWRKFTAWAFFLLIVMFTFLTGFTHLTGYVPGDVNFFDFANWGEYVDTNRKVTDCGCFGDFLKLEPKTSFFKDLGLLIPGFLFILFWRSKHQLFTNGWRRMITIGSFVGITLFCLSNYVWDIPSVDFRPFFEGQHVRHQKQLEVDAASNVKITDYKMTNKESGQVVQIPFAQYMKEFASYPKEEWKLEQIRSEPEVAATKLSDFEMSNSDGDDATEEILGDANYNFWVVSYKLPSKSTTKSITRADTIWVMDTIQLTGLDSIELRPRIQSVGEKTLTKDSYTFDAGLVGDYISKIKPMAEAAEADGFKTRILTKYEDPGKLDDFRHTIQLGAPIYTGDDILLKTIIRSNPGVVLMKDGMIIKKWHIGKLPDYASIKKNFIK